MKLSIAGFFAGFSSFWERRDSRDPGGISGAEGRQRADAPDGAEAQAGRQRLHGSALSHFNGAADGGGPDHAVLRQLSPRLLRHRGRHLLLQAAGAVRRSGHGGHVRDSQDQLPALARRLPHAGGTGAFPADPGHHPPQPAGHHRQQRHPLAGHQGRVPVPAVGDRQAGGHRLLCRHHLQKEGENADVAAASCPMWRCWVSSPC